MRLAISARTAPAVVSAAAKVKGVGVGFPPGPAIGARRRTGVPAIGPGPKTVGDRARAPSRTSGRSQARQAGEASGERRWSRKIAPQSIDCSPIISPPRPRQQWPVSPRTSQKVPSRSIQAL